MGKINKYFQKHDPIWFSAIYMLVMISFIICLIYYPSIIKDATGYVKVLSWFFTLGPVVLAIFHVKNYKKTISSMPRLMSLYMQVVMMFGCIHFYSAASYRSSQMKKETIESITTDKSGLTKAIDSFIGKEEYKYKQSIKGISGEWIGMLGSSDNSKSQIVARAMRSFYDSLHFSLMTSTTVGYGDMYPITFSAKVMVDIQVLVSFFIIAFGVGSFFSQKDAKAKRQHQNNSIKSSH